MKKLLFTLLLAMPVTAGSAEYPDLIEVFVEADVRIAGTRAMRDKGVIVQMYDMTVLDKFVEDLSRGLPPDEDRALKIARKRIAAVDQETMDAVNAAAVGEYWAGRYGLTEYPAIVLNRWTVIYAETDLRDAVREWRRITQ